MGRRPQPAEQGDVEQILLIVKGVVAGLVLSAPLGPVALLCARRSLIFGPTAGLTSGLGAASADMLYAVVAAFGLTVISDWLALHRQTIDLVGGGLLVALGIYLLLVKPKPTDEPSQRQLEPMDVPHAFGATFALTVSNPITLVTFIVLFDYLRAGDLGDRPAMAALLVLGVFAGSMVWWLSLAFGAGRLAGKLGLAGERMLNRGCAVVMLGFGLFGLYRVI
jgi:threonine/homoserine/homoserine lactone efflux protein